MPDAPQAAVLEMHGVEKRFGGVQALRGVDFSVRAGEVHALLGENGAGKTQQVAIIGTDGLPGPSGGIAAVASGQWAATFTYPTGAEQALDLAKKILLDCATSVPATVTVPTQPITRDNAKELNATLQF